MSLCGLSFHRGDPDQRIADGLGEAVLGEVFQDLDDGHLRLCRHPADQEIAFALGDHADLVAEAAECAINAGGAIRRPFLVDAGEIE